MKHHTNIRTRLAIQYSLLVATILMTCFTVALFTFLHGSRDAFNATVGEVHERVARHLEVATDGTISLRKPESTQSRPSRDFGEETMVEVHSKSFGILYRSPAFHGLVLPRSKADIESVKLGKKYYRVMTRPVVIDEKQYLVRVALDEAPIWEEFEELFWIFLAVVPIALILSGFGGYWMAHRALRPIDLIIRSTERISGSNLSERLPIVNEKDELGRLAQVLNGLLSRLEQSFNQLRRFTSDASHELRTPLQALRSLGEVALQKQQENDYYRNVISNMLEETDHMTKLTQTLLTLARADAGTLTLNRTKIPLGEFAEEISRFMAVLAEEKNQKIVTHIEANPIVSIDPIVFRQAIINLIDNAIKYSDSNSQIILRVENTTERPQIVVMDNGPGISSEHVQKIFDRFYRIDKSRSRELGGAGLGLAITKWAIESHGGKITVESKTGKGTTFRVMLPREVSDA